MIDEEYTEHPFFGRRQMTSILRQRGYAVNEKRVRRLMQIMGLEAQYPKPRTTVVNPGHRIYPYLLRQVEINRVNQVWSTDITYIPMPRGFMYLTVVIDWYSRYILSWQLSNTLDNLFCIDALQQALQQGVPEVFNSDQGVQFTSHAFTAILETAKIRISMDGRGRALDNVFVERFWRSLKQEEIYPKAHATVLALHHGLTSYFDFYNQQRPHQGLGGRTPVTVYRAAAR